MSAQEYDKWLSKLRYVTKGDWVLTVDHNAKVGCLRVARDWLLNIVAKYNIDPKYVYELDPYLEKLRCVKAGDIILAEDHNNIVDTLKKFRDVLLGIELKLYGYSRFTPMLDPYIDRLYYVKTKDLVKSDDHNTVVNALKKLRDVLFNIQTTPPPSPFGPPLGCIEDMCFGLVEIPEMKGNDFDCNGSRSVVVLPDGRFFAITIYYDEQYPYIYAYYGDPHNPSKKMIHKPEWVTHELAPRYIGWDLVIHDNKIIFAYGAGEFRYKLGWTSLDFSKWSLGNVASYRTYCARSVAVTERGPNEVAVVWTTWWIIWGGWWGGGGLRYWVCINRCKIEPFSTTMLGCDPRLAIYTKKDMSCASNKEGWSMCLYRTWGDEDSWLYLLYIRPDNHFDTLINTGIYIPIDTYTNAFQVARDPITDKIYAIIIDSYFYPRLYEYDPIGKKLIDLGVTIPIPMLSTPYEGSMGFQIHKSGRMVLAYIMLYDPTRIVVAVGTRTGKGVSWKYTELRHPSGKRWLHLTRMSGTFKDYESDYLASLAKDEDGKIYLLVVWKRK